MPITEILIVVDAESEAEAIEPVVIRGAVIPEVAVLLAEFRHVPIAHIDGNGRQVPVYVRRVREAGEDEDDPNLEASLTADDRRRLEQIRAAVIARNDRAVGGHLADYYADLDRIGRQPRAMMIIHLALFADTMRRILRRPDG
jgi:hypothetical protein